jgi:hypothetical protein
VFRPVFVADGNFKADHVKQKNDNDIWLMDGGGMVPNQKEYSNFLKKALEIPTVSWFQFTNAGLGSVSVTVPVPPGTRTPCNPVPHCYADSVHPGAA